MSQYLLSVWGDPAELEQVPPEMMEQAYADVDKFNTKLQDQGAWVFAGGLHTPDTATVVRKGEDGEVLVTDGPFAEAKEQIGGFWIIEAEDLDAALAWAREATVACQAPVEVRPFQEE
ncbi:MAG TPA: YciI family protein [Acidimicrobiia bacterium]|nr:YciI family protein [Acidimicrobiia bacterium]